MTRSNFLTKLNEAPKDAPVFFTQNLEIDFLIKAYTYGLFPWTTNPVTWWCPDPRCILIPEQIRIQKNMKKFIKKYNIKIDFDFLSLIKLCKEQRKQSWIDEEFIITYNELFKKGYAHSLEIYNDQTLVGGIYGLIIGKMFFGESMVGIEKNVSKIALIKLCELLKPYDFIIDCQIYNSHLDFMGAKNINRKIFLNLLDQKINLNSGFNNFKNLL